MEPAPVKEGGNFSQQEELEKEEARTSFLSSNSWSGAHLDGAGGESETEDLMMPTTLQEVKSKDPGMEDKENQVNQVLLCGSGLEKSYIGHGSGDPVFPRGLTVVETFTLVTHPPGSWPILVAGQHRGHCLWPLTRDEVQPRLN
ncbi:hypothetical protein P7K49_025672 [Saguinus oedipus]|uniref:Uncharacterized protein n=1 Tax=Saguinus oedipus TaxID=9490 RepID=A0ABQ9UJ97_SAGOE|nr:hypothetical protein P7K49_025672 [Saguinus oedipus]